MSAENLNDKAVAPHESVPEIRPGLCAGRDRDSYGRVNRACSHFEMSSTSSMQTWCSIGYACHCTA